MAPAMGTPGGGPVVVIPGGLRVGSGDGGGTTTCPKPVPGGTTADPRVAATIVAALALLAGAQRWFNAINGSGDDRGGTKQCTAPQGTPSDDCDQNRGRIQVQGSDVPLNLSWAWARPTPPTAQEALTQLARIEAGLTKGQRDVRTEAFQRARRQIQQCQASGGCDAPMSRSYQNRNLPRAVRDARVDIEIRTGRAFT